MATHFSILAWRIPWTEEPGGSQYVGPLLLGEPQGQRNLVGSSVACRATESQTRLKRLSTHTVRLFLSL